MSGPGNGKQRSAKSKKTPKGGSPSGSTSGPTKTIVAPFTENVDGADGYRPTADILDELLADEIEENGETPLCLPESPDKTLQRECMLALREPGLKPHERLKIIQTLDKVNERIARSTSEQDVSSELRAWIAEVMADGRSPMNEVFP